MFLKVVNVFTIYLFVERARLELYARDCSASYDFNLDDVLQQKRKSDDDRSAMF